MRIGPAPNKVRRLLNRVDESDVGYWNAQQFTACLIVLDHPEPERHRIERASGKCFVSNCLQIRKRK